MIIIKTSTGQYVTSNVGTLSDDIGQARQFYGWSMAEKIAKEALRQHPHLTTTRLCLRNPWETDWRESQIFHQTENNA